MKLLITDLKKLEEDGIKVNVNNLEHHFYGSISFVVADNPGAHSLGLF